jgi:uncharacterized protein YprB with RNaseH-like and TPR domain
VARRILVIDIETVPNEALFGFVERARGLPRGSVSSDPLMLKSMALDPLYGRIALVGMLASEGTGATDVSSEVLRDQEDAEERRILQHYAKNIGKEDLVVTFNGIRFDIPYLEMRARILGVGLARSVSTYPYGDGMEKRHVDLLNAVTGGGSTSGRGGPPHDLGSVAEVLGIEDEGPEMDGSMVYPTWKKKEFAKLKEYCLNDVILAAEIFDRLFSHDLGGPRFAGAGSLAGRRRRLRPERS